MRIPHVKVVTTEEVDVCQDAQGRGPILLIALGDSPDICLLVKPSFRGRFPLELGYDASI